MSHDTSHHLDHAHEAHDSHGVGHLVSPKILIATGAALLVLTVVTVLAASVDFEAAGVKELNIFIAMGIAVVKASLVCLFFMHLRWDRPFNAFVLVGSLALVGLFISFAMTDRTEYGEEIIPGESAVIQNKLLETPPAHAATTAPSPSVQPAEGMGAH